LLLPKNPSKNTLWTKICQALEWLLVPLITVFLSGMPALDAQTRLALNKRLEFWVTEKEKKKTADISAVFFILPFISRLRPKP
jgi:hypothetical protein